MAADLIRFRPAGGSCCKTTLQILVRGGCCAMLTMQLTGCKGTQSASIPNPFLSADRVPAPPTRMPPQGAAQPYYPGDPLPQSPGIQRPAVQPLGALAPSPDITPLPADGSLASAPSVGARVASNEPVIRIPGDEDSVRFAMREGFGGSERGPVARHGGSMTEATSSGLAPLRQQVSITPVVDNGAAAGLFREPVGRPQPPALLDENTAPRIRLPNSANRASEQVYAPSGVTTTSYDQVASNVGQVQTTALPPAGYVPSMTVGQDAGGFNSTEPPASDGFRPRRSARERFRNRSSDSGISTMRVTPG